MATRSRIGLVNQDGSIDSIYCHFDGYISGNGRILDQHYNSLEKIQELIALGDLSSLGEEIGLQHPFSSYEGFRGSEQDYKSMYGKMCTAYMRDRGETGCLPVHSDGVDDFLEIAEEYNYLFSPGVGEWMVDFGEGFQRLSAELQKEIA